MIRWASSRRSCAVASEILGSSMTCSASASRKRSRSCTPSTSNSVPSSGCAWWRAREVVAGRLGRGHTERAVPSRTERFVAAREAARRGRRWVYGLAP